MFENAKKITLSQQLDFEFTQFEIVSFLKKHEDNLFKSRAGYLMLMAKGISQIFNVGLSDILELEGQSLLEIGETDIEEFLEVIATKEKGKQSLNKDQLEKSLLKIWNFITHVINSAQPGDIKDQVEFKGKTYKLPAYSKNSLTGEDNHVSITTKQAIETIQMNNNYETWLEQALKKDKTARHSNEGKDMLFTKYVSEVVLLLNEEIPFDEDKFREWMSEQMLHFQDIDYQTVVYIENWFNGYMKELKNEKKTLPSLKATGNLVQPKKMMH